MKQIQHFQPHRLKRVITRLTERNVKPRIKTVEEPANLFFMDEKIIGNIPIFWGLVSEFPKIFPKDWTYSDGQYYWLGDENKKTLTSILNFFGIGLSMFSHLFIPGGQMVSLYGGELLSSDSTTKDLAMNMILFIESQEFSMDLINEINVLISKN